MAKKISQSKKEKQSFTKVAKAFEKAIDRAEKERKTKRDWQNPGARIDEERFF
tara:strand:+ start:233 stop:391 length:159 start_codon:yes stop_codon:yes gene_type:complete